MRDFPSEDYGEGWFVSSNPRPVGIFVIEDDKQVPTQIYLPNGDTLGRVPPSLGFDLTPKGIK